MESAGGVTSSALAAALSEPVRLRAATNRKSSSAIIQFS
jgi:hypothetical protein